MKTQRYTKQLRDASGVIYAKKKAGKESRVRRLSVAQWRERSINGGMVLCMYAYSLAHVVVKSVFFLFIYLEKS